MKSLILLATAAVAFQAQARTLSFECTPGDVTTMNHFESFVGVEINNKGEFQGDMTLQVSRAGNNSTSQALGSMGVNGTVKVIPAGDFASREFSSLTLSSQDSKVRGVLNVGLRGPTSSYLLIDGVQYQAECTELDVTN